jgi:hypothetical protein
MEPQPEEEKPPLLPNWNSWYLLVLGIQVLLIALFYGFSALYP